MQKPKKNEPIKDKKKLLKEISSTETHSVMYSGFIRRLGMSPNEAQESAKNLIGLAKEVLNYKIKEEEKNNT